MRKLTSKEKVIMEHYWAHGPMFVRELQELYPDPKPSFSTLSTQVRTLQADGFMDHEAFGSNYRYFAAVSKEEYRASGLGGLVDEFFSSSYKKVVMTFLKEDKLSVDELKDIIDQIESGK